MSDRVKDVSFYWLEYWYKLEFISVFVSTIWNGIKENFRKIVKLPSSAPVGNFSWNWAELALLSVFPPSAGRGLEKYPNCLIQINWLPNICMADDLIFLVIGRLPQLFCKWKTTSSFYRWKMTSIFWLIEDDLLFLNGRRPQMFFMEDNLIFF